MLGLRVEIDPLLRDCDYGRWAGRRLAEVHRDHPDLVKLWLNDPHSAPHGGETLEAVCARAAEWLRLQQCKEGHIVGISHPAFIRAAVLNVLGAGPGCFWRIDIAPLTGTDFRWNGERWVLRGTGLPLDSIFPYPRQR
jgi:broad specificity phosphatase PhoE